MCLFVGLALPVPAIGETDPIEEVRTCRERGIAEMRSKQVISLPDPKRVGAILTIALPATTAIVRSAAGHAYRVTTWFTLHLTSNEAVDAACERMSAVRAAISDGLAESSLEGSCTIAEEQALTLRLQERVRDVLADEGAVLRSTISSAERLD